MKKIFNKIYKKFKKYFSTNILFVTYTVSSLIIGTLLRFLTMGSIFDIRAIVCDFVIIILFGCFGYLIKPKNQFKYFFSVSCIFTLACIINAIYYRFYTNYASVSLLSTLTMLTAVSDSVSTELELIYFVYLICPIVMLLVNKLLVKKNYYYEVGKDEKGKVMFRGTGLCALIISFLVIITMSSSDGSRLVKLWNRDSVVKRFGIYVYTISDIIQSIQPAVRPMFGYDEATQDFLDFYTDNPNIKEINDYTNIFEGKNVIFVHMESIQNYLIDLEINDTVITPNINKLSREGMYFSNFYPQISVGTSSDTEFTLSTGLLPSTSGTVFVNYYNREYDTIQKAFKNKGYYTFSMHANDKNYWNRNVMYKSLGYDNFYAKDSYDIPLDKSSLDYVGLGLSDKSFFSQIISILKDIKSDNKNFMGTIITLSNHSPFNDLEKYGDLDFSIKVKKQNSDSYGKVSYYYETVPYLEDTEMGNYLKSAHYADEALGEFIKLIKDNGLDKDTVFIFYGDHESKLGKSNLDLLYNYDPYKDDIKSEDDPTYVSLDNYKYDLLKNTPLIIWSSDQSFNKEIKDVMGMWDVYPTIANMFNLEYKYPLGHDIFSGKEKIVVFPNGDIITNKVFYNNLKDEYILLSDEPISSEYIDRIKNYALERLEVSKGIIVHNLIKDAENKLERFTK